MSFYRGVRDAIIAPWLGVGSYGTAVDILGIRNFTITTNVSTDTLRGDDHDLDVHSRMDGVVVDWEQAEVNQTVFDILAGGTLVSNANYEDVLIGEEDAPYVGLAGKMVASDGSEMHLFVPKCKLAGNLVLQAQLDTYSIPAAQFRGVYEGVVNGIFRRRKFFVPTTLTIPLATTPGL
jgi:hypothetical protein